MKNIALISLFLITSLPLFSRQKLQTIIQTGHKSSMNCANFSHDGTYLVTSSLLSNTAIVWDAITGKQLRNVVVTKDVIGVAIDGQNRNMVTAEKNGVLTYWDFQTGEKLREFKAHDDHIRRMEISPNRQFLLTMDQNMMKIWNVASGNKINEIKVEGYLSYVGFGADSKTVVGMNSNQGTHVYDINSGNLLRSFPFVEYSKNFKISSDNNYIGVGYTGESDGIKLFDFNTTQEVQTINLNKEYQVNFEFSGDNKTIIVVNNKSYTAVFSPDNPATKMEWYSISTGKRTNKIEGMERGNYLALLSPDKSRILTSLNIRDAKTGEIIHPLGKYKGHAKPGGIYNIYFKDNQEHLIKSADIYGFVRTWDLKKGKPVNSKKLNNMLANNKTKAMFRSQVGVAVMEVGSEKLLGQYKLPLERGVIINKFDLSTDGKYLCTKVERGSREKTVYEGYIFDSTTGENKKIFEEPGNVNVAAVKFTPDSKYLIVGISDFFDHGDKAGIVKIYDTQDFNLVKELSFNHVLDLITFSPDKKRMIVATRVWGVGKEKSSNEIHFFDINTWSKKQEIKIKNPYGWGDLSLVFSKDGQRMFVSVYNIIEMYDMSSGTYITSFRQFDKITALALTEDKNKLFTGDEFGKIKIWDVSNNRAELATLLYLTGVQDYKVNSIGTRGTRTFPGNKGAYLTQVAKGSAADKAGIKGGDVIVSYNGNPVKIATDYTDKLLREERPGNIIKLTYKRGEQQFNTQVKVEETIFPNQPSGKDDWAVIMPDYHYMASKHIHNSVHFVKGLKYYSFENFDLMYNRPEVVIEKLGFAEKEYLDLYKQAYRKRLSKMGFENIQKMENISLPEVIVKKYKIPAETTNTKVTIPMKAFSYNAHIDRLNVYVNDVPVYGAKGLSLASQKTKDMEKNIELELSQGHNKIQVSVHDASGFESLKETIEIDCNKPKTKPNLYIVSIGVSEYQESDYNLTYAAKDAEDLANIYNSNNSHFGSVKTLKYLNADANKENILKAKSVLMNSKVDDEVILFVAGHGLLDDNLDYYFGTNNINFLNPSENGLKYEDLESLLDGIPARKKLMLIDACHSGEVDKDATPASGGTEILASAQNVENGTVKFRGFKGGKTKSLGLQNSFELMKELFADLRRGTGAMVISSASGAEYAYESEEWNNGVFTYSVLEALRNNTTDANYDGSIQVSELRDFVIKRVSELTNGKQHPTSRNENLEFDFSIW